MAAAIVVLLAALSRAGGPKYIAGTSYFDAASAGQPIIWPQGQITYYTDQGDLSPILPGSSADSFVADAFSQWTAVPTAALAATNAGHLAEDVNGSNVIRNSDGTLTMPADIQSTATSTPVGIVYDNDGSVTDALLGTGAGNSSQCFFNAAFGGSDNFAPSANIQHALVVINGQCAQQSSQLTDVEYRLVRVLGGVLGLGWSQLNLNVVTGAPRPSADDLAGFPVMHFTDLLTCVPITICYPNPLQPALDDAAAISRLYPVTAQNQSNFPGKQIFSTTTARVHGSVWFTDPSSKPTQPMQGANVVARWIDPKTGTPSTRITASSVSGFLFTGNAGNSVTGFTDALGNAYSQFGSADPSVEGFFDLAGLQIPNGASATQYQLTVESLDPLLSTGVGPYGPYQVTPSGTLQPIIVTVAPGVDVAQDILMPRSAQAVAQWAASESWNAPAPVPPGGDWIGSLSGYGDAAYFLLPAQANRTFSVAVTGLDETQRPSEAKAQPVIGIWTFGDPAGTPPPAFTSSPFNGPTLALTRLDAQIFSSTRFVVGIADLRGDGRPDYHYHAHVLYADSLSPPRARVTGGAIMVHGTGFAPGLTATIGASSAAPLAVSAGQMILAVTAQTDGPQNVTLTDPASGAFSIMTNALTLGAAADDNVVLLQGLDPPTPVGTPAANPPFSIRVLAADGMTPVGGATLGWTTTNAAALSICGGLSSCSTITDDSGVASTTITPMATGLATITATLAPGVYSPAKSISTTLLGTATASDIGAMTPYLSIAQGATLTLPLTARVMGNQLPQPAVSVNFNVVSGAGTLSSAQAQTDGNGYATVTLTVVNFSATVHVTACVGTANSPCTSIYATPVPASQLNLQPVSGAGQAIALGQAFQPMIVRVLDSSTPPIPVIGATVTFQSTVLRPVGDSPAGGSGETNPGNPAMPVILSVIQSSIVSDANGLASIVPSVGSFTGTLDVEVSATAGTSAALQSILQALPAMSGSGPASHGPSRGENLPARIRQPLPFEW
jgi:hypothetical protein